jgi:enoyl-CoA hydratase/carnithine racemase
MAPGRWINGAGRGLIGRPDAGGAQVDFSQIIYEKSDRVATITLNRPRQLNAFTPTMGTEIRKALRDADGDDGIGAVIVTGAGRAYCAGADMAELASRVGTEGEPEPPVGAPREDLRPDFRGTFSYMMALRKPIIGAYNGACVGIGFTSSLYFDMRIAAESARIGLIFVQRGLAIEHGASWMLPRLVGPAKAMELAVTGRLITGREALEIGLVNYVVPDDQLMAKAREIAGHIAHNCAPLGVAEAKRSIYEHLFTDLATAMRNDDELMRRMWKTEDFKEGITAFREKRPPRFTGK